MGNNVHLTEKDSETDTDDVAGTFDSLKRRQSTSGIDPSIIDNVPVLLNAYLGSRELTVAELMALKDGAVIELDASLNHDAELRLGDKIIARGEIVAVGDKFGIRISQISN